MEEHKCCKSRVPPTDEPSSRKYGESKCEKDKCNSSKFGRSKWSESMLVSSTVVGRLYVGLHALKFTREDQGPAWAEAQLYLIIASAPWPFSLPNSRLA